MSNKKQRPLAQNRKARHDYHILETMEAGIVLQGTEIKSIRQGKMNIRDSYVTIYNGEAWLRNAHISPYEQGNQFNHDPLRDRKLLLHKREIAKLYGQVRQSGHTIIPLRVYLVRGRAKVLIGVAKGKRDYDRRHDLRERQAKRDIERAMADRNHY